MAPPTTSSGNPLMLGMPPASETTSGRDATANSARISEAVIPAVRAAYRSTKESRLVCVRAALPLSAPSLWIVEDAHLADRHSLSLLAETLRVSRRPLLLVVTTRPQRAPAMRSRSKGWSNDST